MDWSTSLHVYEQQLNWSTYEWNQVAHHLPHHPDILQKNHVLTLILRKMIFCVWAKKRLMASEMLSVCLQKTSLSGVKR